MPAAKITREDVAQAIDNLKNQGIPDPGVHRLRMYLGRGSVTTIARFKNELRLIERQKITSKSKPSLPDPIARLAGQLWNELLEAVESIEKELKAAADQRIAEAQAQVNTMTAERDEAFAHMNQLNTDLDATKEQSEQRRQNIHALETELSESKGRLNAGQTLITTLQAREHDLKATLAETARQAATREKGLNDQLASERERGFGLQKDAEQQRQKLENEIQALRDMLSGQREYTEKTIASLQENIHHIEARLNTRQQELETKQRKSSELKAQHRELQEVANKGQQNIIRLTTALEAKEQEIETLKLHLNDSQSYRQEAKITYDKSIKQLEERIMELKNTLSAKSIANEKKKN